MRRFGRGRFGQHGFAFRRRGARRRRCASTLADAPAGQRVCLRGFSSSLPAERLSHLLAYGLAPGRWVRVIQHEPVTVVQVEHSELALENDLARQIEVTPLDGSPQNS
jgi:Fe2+ transport system protein FeoA